MRIVTKDLREITNAKGRPMIRFSVTFIDNDGDALITQEGFTCVEGWKVRPPMSRTKFGSSTMRFTRISAKFEHLLAQSIARRPDTHAILGPPPVELMQPMTEDPGETVLEE